MGGIVPDDDVLSAEHQPAFPEAQAVCDFAVSEGVVGDHVSAIVHVPPAIMGGTEAGDHVDSEAYSRTGGAM